MIETRIAGCCAGITESSDQLHLRKKIRKNCSSCIFFLENATELGEKARKRINYSLKVKL